MSDWKSSDWQRPRRLSVAERIRPAVSGEAPEEPAPPRPPASNSRPRRNSTVKRGCQGCLVVAAVSLTIVAVPGYSMLQRLSNMGPQSAVPQFVERQVVLLLTPADPIATGKIVVSWDSGDSYARGGISLGYPEFTTFASRSSGASQPVATYSAQATASTLFIDPYVRLSIQGSSPQACVGPCEIALGTDSCRSGCQVSMRFSVQLASAEGPTQSGEVRVPLALAVSVPAGNSLPSNLSVQLQLDRPQQAEPSR